MNELIEISMDEEIWRWYENEYKDEMKNGINENPVSQSETSI